MKIFLDTGTLFSSLPPQDSRVRPHRRRLASRSVEGVRGRAQGETAKEREGHKEDTRRESERERAGGRFPRQ